jgi:hypothetical protein
MKIGDIVKHAPSGEFVIIMDLVGEDGALICFTTGKLVGYKQLYSKNCLKAVKKCP